MGLHRTALPGRGGPGGERLPVLSLQMIDDDAYWRGLITVFGELVAAAERADVRVRSRCPVPWAKLRQAQKLMRLGAKYGWFRVELACRHFASAGPGKPSIICPVGVSSTIR